MSPILTPQTRRLICSGLCSAALFACGSSSATDGNPGAGAPSAGASGALAGGPSGAGAAGMAMGDSHDGGTGGSTAMTGGSSGSMVGSAGADTAGGTSGGGAAGASAGSGGGAVSGGAAGTAGAAGADAMTTGQYSVTLNATTPYALGSEHVGHTVFGTVIDTTPGANRARVGRIQETPVVAGQQVKWVWPKIMVAGHTYELAMFGDDYSKNRTCVVTAGTPNPGWIIKIPAPTADFEFPWKRPVTRTDGPECVDFPTGPVPPQ